MSLASFRRLSQSQAKKRLPLRRERLLVELLEHRELLSGNPLGTDLVLPVDSNNDATDIAIITPIADPTDGGSTPIDNGGAAPGQPGGSPSAGDETLFVDPSLYVPDPVDSVPPTPQDPAPASLPADFAAVTTSPVGRWVARLYSDLLYRAPNAGEVDFWQKALQAGGTQAQIATLVADSAESRGNAIRSDYETLLGRAPEAGAVEYWQDAAAAGLSDDARQALFLSSNEFYSQQGASDGSWLEGMYGVLLGRAPDEAGLKSWNDTLAGGVGRFDVAMGFVTSPENQGWNVADAYSQLLDRGAQGVDLGYWGGALQSGLTSSQLQAAIATSTEYLSDRLVTSVPSDRFTNVTAAIGQGGTLVWGDSTRTTDLQLTGRGTPGASFVVFVDGRAETRGRVDVNGDWTVALPQRLATGRHQFIARPDGGHSAPGADLLLDVDHTAPSISLQVTDELSEGNPIIAVTVDPGDNMGYKNAISFDIDWNNDGKFTGQGEANAYESTVDPGANRVVLPLGRAEHRVQARMGDAAGNIGYTMPLNVGEDPGAGFVGSQALLDLAGRDGAMPRDFWEQMYIIDDSDRVQINASLRAGHDFNTFVSDLEKIGFEVQTLVPQHNVAIGYLPISSIDELASVPHFRSAVPEARPITHSGIVPGDGDRPMKTDVFRQQFNVDGKGVAVGVLSDSVSRFQGGLADSQRTGDLPANVTVVADAASGSDEGRAMLEIVHDIAPGSPLFFRTGFRGAQDMANGIIELANRGCKVIVDDIGYLRAPMFNDGVIAQAVEQVVSRGIVYLSSAGNQGPNGYLANWRGVSGNVGGLSGTFMDFGSGAVKQSFTLGGGASARVTFGWDMAYLDTGAATGNYRVTNDLDIIVTDANNNITVQGNDNNLNTNLANEFIQVVNTGGSTATFNFSFRLINGAAPNMVRWTAFVNGPDLNQAGGPGPSTFGHSAAKGAISVAAASYQTPTVPEPFTSYGGALPYFFDINGARLATPQIRNKPDVTGIDDVNTTFFGSNTDSTPYPNFQGTSAAAPDTAALVALQLQQKPGATPQAVLQNLQKTALDLLTPGFDRRTGAGLVQARPIAATGTGASGDDVFESNDTPGKATNLGTLVRGTRSYASLTINVKAGVPDSDWYKVTMGANGKFTASLAIAKVIGDLQLEVYSVAPNGALTLLGSDVKPNVTSRLLSTTTTKNKVLLINVKGLITPQTGTNFPIGGYTLTTKLE